MGTIASDPEIRAVVVAPADHTSPWGSTLAMTGLTGATGPTGAPKAPPVDGGPGGSARTEILRLQAS